MFSLDAVFNLEFIEFSKASSLLSVFSAICFPFSWSNYYSVRLHDAQRVNICTSLKLPNGFQEGVYATGKIKLVFSLPLDEHFLLSTLKKSGKEVSSLSG